MHLKTILNRVHKITGFVYQKMYFTDAGDIEVQVRPRKGSSPICSGCGRRGSTYDTAWEPRRFAFVPLWAIAVVLVYRMRRVDCRRCGVKVETVPWATGKRRLACAYAVFLSRWARRLSWRQTASIFKTSWDTVYRSVAWMVDHGLEHRDLGGITAIGVDEVQYRRGHKYLTVVYQINDGCRRLLWVGQHRTAKTLLRFFKDFGTERTANIKYVCSDMWQAYLKVIRKKATKAIHILDRFHIVAQLNKAIDKIRAEETRQLMRDGYEPLLKRSRWRLLKRPKNLSKKQRYTLADLMQYNLRTVRAYLLKERFQLLWGYVSPTWAGRYLDAWITRALRSRLTPIKTVARSLRTHRQLILNWFRAKKQFSSGIVEGLNANVKLTFKKAYGYRTYQAAEIALYHTLGQLPEPKLTHEFC